MGYRCKNKRHLGIHTELFVESMADLMECGAVDNSMKAIDKGISTFGFAMGSDRLNKFLDHNPLCESRRFMYSNDPYVIAKTTTSFRSIPPCRWTSPARSPRRA